jgi:chemotaxis signal transduction protein
VPFNWGRSADDGGPGRTRTVALFTVACVDYAIDAARVRHLVPPGREVGGSIVFEGSSFPLIDLRSIFRLPSVPRTGRVLLIDDGAARNAALMVDAVGTPVRLDERTIMPLPAVFRGQERARFEALAVVDDRIVVVVAPRGLLADARPRQVAV